MFSNKFFYLLVMFLKRSTLKAKMHLHFKMTFFNDHFLIKKKKYVKINYSVKNENLNKAFHC